MNNIKKICFINPRLIFSSKDIFTTGIVYMPFLLAYLISKIKKLNVKIFEANIDTIAVQGPKSFKLMEDIFGNDITKLKFFKYDFFKFKNNKFLISRSGFSKQGGYEIHVDKAKDGLELYDHFFDIGKKYNVKPGAPNHAERIEGGLLSYGNDMLISDNPFECGFEKLVHLNSNVDRFCIANFLLSHK